MVFRRKTHDSRYETNIFRNTCISYSPESPSFLRVRGVYTIQQQTESLSAFPQTAVCPLVPGSLFLGSITKAARKNVTASLLEHWTLTKGRKQIFHWFKRRLWLFSCWDGGLYLVIFRGLSFYQTGIKLGTWRQCVAAGFHFHFFRAEKGRGFILIKNKQCHKYKKDYPSIYPIFHYSGFPVYCYCNYNTLNILWIDRDSRLMKPFNIIPPFSSPLAPPPPLFSPHSFGGFITKRVEFQKFWVH